MTRRRKTVKNQPGNEDLSGGMDFYTFWGKEEEKNGFRPQKVAADDVPRFFPCSAHNTQ